MRALLTVWLSWLALMTGANLAAPLYAVYAAHFGFSELELTAIFACYAFVLIPALLLFGRLSDRFGRRPVLFAGLAVACAGLVLFIVADSTGWLFAARAAQGLAVGMISGPATAALVELDPSARERQSKRPALLAGLAQAGGSALGPLIAGILAQWAPQPLRLSYLILLGATAITAIFTLKLPEPTTENREPWRIQRPRVPAEIRADFARVSLSAATMWGSVALYLSVVPSYAETLLHSHNLALLGAIAALALGASCGALVVAQRVHTSPRRSRGGPQGPQGSQAGGLRRSQAGGLGVLALGLAALVIVAPLHSLPLLLAGAIATGAGHGLGFLNAQDELNAIAPDSRRGEVTAAFVCCIYLMVGGAVIVTGLLSLTFSLPVAVAVIAVVLAATAVVAATWQARHIRTARFR
ncbi:MAG: MFS transporter [Streptosporangiaceae bacterium]|nr:MFS transporter [Streptosporangiaceae bacterium]